jgi:hypothetical protein
LIYETAVRSTPTLFFGKKQERQEISTAQLSQNTEKYVSGQKLAQHFVTPNVSQASAYSTTCSDNKQTVTHVPIKRQIHAKFTKEVRKIVWSLSSSPSIAKDLRSCPNDFSFKTDYNRSLSD